MEWAWTRWTCAGWAAVREGKSGKVASCTLLMYALVNVCLSNLSVFSGATTPILPANGSGALTVTTLACTQTASSFKTKAGVQGRKATLRA